MLYLYYILLYMKGFIVSMTLVTGGVIIISTFNNGARSIASNDTAIKSVINEQSFTIATVDTNDHTSEIVKVNPSARNKIISITHSQFAQKLNDDEKITLNSLDGKTLSVTRSSIDALQPGVYIARHNNLVYRMIKR